MVVIDGSYGEGGGQILRSSLTLSLLTGKPFKLVNIRVKRKKPGLMPQHLACVKACKEISQAKTSGDTLGSTSLTFEPQREPKSGTYLFDIGTAGATTLLFQTLFLPLTLTNGADLTLKGGTHVPYSPTYHYLEYIYLPLLEPLGFKATLALEKVGFYPKGSGIIKARIKPAEDLKAHPFSNQTSKDVCKPFDLEKVLIVSLISKDLPRHILERQANSVIWHLKNFSGVDGIEQLCEVKFELVESISPGTMVFIMLQGKIFRAGFSSLGAKGLPAEKVGEIAAQSAVKFLKKGAQVDPHLADQLVLPLAYIVYLGKETSISYTTSEITMHFLSQAWLIPQFLEDVKVSIESLDNGKGIVKIERS